METHRHVWSHCYHTPQASHICCFFWPWLMAVMCNHKMRDFSDTSPFIRLWPKCGLQVFKCLKHAVLIYLKCPKLPKLRSFVAFSETDFNRKSDTQLLTTESAHMFHYCSTQLHPISIDTRDISAAYSITFVVSVQTSTLQSTCLSLQTDLCFCMVHIDYLHKWLSNTWNNLIYHIRLLWLMTVTTSLVGHIPNDNSLPLLYTICLVAGYNRSIIAQA